ncbi:MAG: YidC/Oxa1 family membrane protein insertase [Oscillospiraceae bacterium]|nr:YidC/Oxa1 family membrane protein insertase [Oscillospiraceae bacterium]
MYNTLIVEPFGWILKFSYNLVGSYGIAIIIFTIIAKLIMLPFQMKSKKSMMEMNRLQPQLRELERRYKNDKEKYSLEVQKLYKKEGVSVFGGCLPLLITLPIMIGLYSVVRQPLTHIFNISAEQISQMAEALRAAGVTAGLTGAAEKSAYMLEIGVASHLKEYGEILTGIAPNLAGVDFNFLGIDLAAIPNFKYITPLWVIPALSGLTGWFSGWLMRRTQPKVSEQAAANNGIMNVMMPLMSVYIAFVVPAGLGFYWIISNVLTAVQEPLLTIYYKKKAEAKALEGEK